MTLEKDSATSGTEPAQQRTVMLARGLAALCFAFGIWLALLAAAVIVANFSDSAVARGKVTDLGAIALINAVPALLYGAVFRLGLSLWRRPTRPWPAAVGCAIAGASGASLVPLTAAAASQLHFIGPGLVPALIIAAVLSVLASALFVTWQRR